MEAALQLRRDGAGAPAGERERQAAAPGPRTPTYEERRYKEERDQPVERAAGTGRTGGGLQSGLRSVGPAPLAWCRCPPAWPQQPARLPCRPHAQAAHRPPGEAQQDQEGLAGNTGQEDDDQRPRPQEEGAQEGECPHSLGQTALRPSALIRRCRAALPALQGVSRRRKSAWIRCRGVKRGPALPPLLCVLHNCKAHPLHTTPRDSGLCCLASRGLAVTLIKEAAPNKHSGRQMR